MCTGKSFNPYTGHTTILSDKTVEFIVVKIINNKGLCSILHNIVIVVKLYICNPTNPVEEEDSHLLHKGWNILQGQNYPIKKMQY